MSGRNIGQLNLPPDAFRVDLQTDDPTGVIEFETAAEAKSWLDKRVRWLAASIAKGDLNHGERRAAKTLVKSLMQTEAMDAPRLLSPASNVDMRVWRIRISGALWKLIQPLSTEEWAFFTIVLPSWWVKSKKLKK